MTNFDDFCIISLLIVVCFVYHKKYITKQENLNFEVKIPKSYPINPKIHVKYNNYKNSIEDYRLDKLQEVLTKVRKLGNDNNLQYKQ